MTIKIHVLPLEGVFDTGLSCLLDAFSEANRLAENHGLMTRFEVTVRGVRPGLHSGQGMSINQTEAFEGPADWLIVPAMGGLTIGQMAARLSTDEAQAVIGVLREHAARGGQIGCASTSTFLLAEAGLLDGRQATTSWWLTDLFRQRYPTVQLDDTRSLVEDGMLVTAGASMSHFDLALLVIRHASPTLADQAARYLVTDPFPTQSAMGVTHNVASVDPVVLRFENWARKHLSQGFSLAEAAREAGASPRSLSRHLQAALSKSPLEFFQDLRVECAVHMLRTTHASVDQVAAAVGYADGVTLRGLLRKKVGQSARELRLQGSVGAPGRPVAYTTVCSIGK